MNTARPAWASENVSEYSVVHFYASCDGGIGGRATRRHVLPPSVVV